MFGKSLKGEFDKLLPYESLFIAYLFLAKISASYPCLLELSQRTGKHFMGISWHPTSIDPILSSSFPVTFVIGKYKKTSYYSELIL